MSDWSVQKGSYILLFVAVCGSKDQHMVLQGERERERESSHLTVM